MLTAIFSVGVITQTAVVRDTNVFSQLRDLGGKECTDDIETHPLNQARLEREADLVKQLMLCKIPNDIRFRLK